MNLERELRELAIEFPPEPDLRAGVLARLDARPRRRLWPVVALATLAVVGALLAIPQTRAAILEFFRIGNVRVERVETQPTATRGFLEFGRMVTIEEAQEAVGFELAVPRVYQAVYLDEPYVTILVRPGVFLTQWGGTGAPVIEKEAGPNTRFEEVDVGDAIGLWISGAEHVVVRGPERRTAGNVLIWVRDAVTYRLEGAVSRDAAVEIGRNLRRP